MKKTEDIFVLSGKILIYRLYDVAYEIDLSRVEERLREETRRLRIERKPFSRAFEFANPPVVFQLKGIEREIEGRRVAIGVHGKAYDFGVLSIILEIPVRETAIASFEQMALYIDRWESLEDECRGQLSQVVAILGDAVKELNISRFEEDYSVFYIESLAPGMDTEEFLKRYDISRIMFCEVKPLAGHIKAELLQSRFSYYDDDLVVLSWDNALILEPSGSMEIADILEFANAQLLELRYYDHVVDKELDDIHANISRKEALSIWRIKHYEKYAAEVRRTIAELTDITDKIDTSLKVTEDVYYAKIYLSALRLFRVKEVEGSIKKKLEIASNIYDMFCREISAKRTELLELAIVILIILEIILFLK